MHWRQEECFNTKRCDMLVPRIRTLRTAWPVEFHVVERHLSAWNAVDVNSGQD